MQTNNDRCVPAESEPHRLDSCLDILRDTWSCVDLWRKPLFFIGVASSISWFCYESCVWHWLYALSSSLAPATAWACHLFGPNQLFHSGFFADGGGLWRVTIWVSRSYVSASRRRWLFGMGWRLRFHLNLGVCPCAEPEGMSHRWSSGLLPPIVSTWRR